MFKVIGQSLRSQAENIHKKKNSATRALYEGKHRHGWLRAQHWGKAESIIP